MIDLTSTRRLRWFLKTYFGVLVLFLYLPIAVLVIFSLNDSPRLALPLSGFTTRWYAEFLANAQLVAALRTSAVVAAASSAVAVALGFTGAYVLVRRSFLGKGTMAALLLSPLIIPYIVFGVALLILFHAVGVPLSVTTVVIGHVVVSLPYTVLVLVPRIQQINVQLEEAARDLGANGLRVFRTITLPLTLPALVSAFMIAFVLSFDEYVIASFVVGTQTTFPIYLFSQLRFPDRLPPVLAVAVVVLAASLLVVVAAEVSRRFFERRLDAERSVPQAG